VPDLSQKATLPDSLLDLAAQERLFRTIQSNYSSLLLALHTSTTVTSSSPKPRTQSVDPVTAQKQTFLHSLRSLREALLSTYRLDAFAVEVYSFTARVAILLQHKESYLPSLLHLLRNIHPNRPLPDEHLAEFAAYYVLHLACVLGELNEAYLIRHEFRNNGGTEESNPQVKSCWSNVDVILRSLVRNDYWSWSRIRQNVGLHSRRLMDMGEDLIRKRAVACLSKAYFELQRVWLEDVVGMSWVEFQRRYIEGRVEGWGVSENGEKVLTRSRRKR